MELRPELVPAPISDARRAAIRDRIRRVEDAIEAREDVADLIREFNEFTGRQYGEDMFRNYWRSIDLEDFVRQAARPKPTPAPGVTRAELVEVVRRAMPQNGDAEYEAYMEVLDANVPLECASGLIFYPPDYEPATNTWAGGRSIGEYDPAPEQIVEWALAPGGGSADAEPGAAADGGA
ncbi:MAG: hypothetical protein U0840_02790 [Gemmataceae bacterium]